jgi:AcrR family transcriptional regulator
MPTPATEPEPDPPPITAVAAGAVEPPAPRKRVRMDAADRRAALLDVAEEAFAELGYQQASLAEIAKRARVSKTLLYHYYPDGRTELYGEVERRLADDLLARCRQAATGPTAAERRLADLVDAVFGFFADQPGAFRLLMVEPFTIGDPGILGLALAVRLELTRELTTLFSTTNAALPTIEGAAVAAVGSLLHECELWMAGNLTRATATEVTVSYLRGGLKELGLL